MATITTSIGTRANDNYTISSVSESGPYTVTLTASVDTTTTFVGDTFSDEKTTTPNIYLITAISGADLTVEDVFGAGAAPDDTGSSQAFTKRSYSTVQEWDDDFDDTTLYPSTRDAVGEMYADSDFDEAVTFDTTNDANIDSITLTAPEGQRHDGTPNTGVRLLATAHRAWSFASYFGPPHVVEWIEFDGDKTYQVSITTGRWGGDASPESFIRNNIYHGSYRGVSSSLYAIQSGKQNGSFTWNVQNNVIYDIENTSGHSSAGIIGIVFGQTSTTCKAQNNTIWDLHCGGGTASSNGAGIHGSNSSGQPAVLRNNVISDVSYPTGTAHGIYNFDATLLTEEYNATFDSSATGTGAQTGVVAADIFVSTTGTIDLTPLSGGELDGTGTDLVATPTNINIDITGRDRDAEDDDWDIGAYQSVAASSGYTATLGHTLVSTPTFDAAVALKATLADTVTVTPGLDANVNLTATLADTAAVTPALFADVNLKATLTDTLSVSAVKSAVVDLKATLSGSPSPTANLEAEQLVAGWTLNNIDSTHHVVDGPRINAAILDYNNANAPAQITEAGLRAYGDGTYVNALSTRTITEKLYFEATVISGIQVQNQVGIQNDANPNAGTNTTDSNVVMINTLGDVYEEGVAGTTYASYAVNDRINVAFDPDTGKTWFGKNGTWLGGGDPAAGTGEDATLSGSTFYIVAGNAWDGSFRGEMTYDFGQKGFVDTPPSGFKGLGDFD